jgi:hypothetical protein
MQDKTHEACRKESGMFEIDDAQFIAIGDKKVVRCNIGITEVEFLMREVDALVLFYSLKDLLCERCKYSNEARY